MAYQEKERVEKELDLITNMKDVNLIDQYKQEYDAISNEIKQLDNEFLLNEKASDPQYIQKRERLHHKRLNYVALFEEQLRREEELPEKKKDLEERLQAVVFEIDELLVDIGKEEKVVVYHMDHSDKTRDSVIESLQNCQQQIEKEMEAIDKVQIDSHFKCRVVMKICLCIHSHWRAVTIIKSL